MMAKMAKIKPVLFRRKREGKTNYRKRIALLKSGNKRLVVRKSLRNTTAQIIEYSPGGDKVIASANSAELEKYGYKFNKGNIVAAYLTGLLIGKKSKQKGIGEAIVDIGLNPSTKGSRIYAVVKGAVDSGLKISCKEEILPKEDVIKGGHIKNYAEKVKQDAEKYKKQFSSYMKNNLVPEKITEVFEDIKNKIIK